MDRRQEVVKIITELKKTMTQEQIATAIEVSGSTVYCWGRGSRKPSNLARKALKKLLPVGK